MELNTPISEEQAARLRARLLRFLEAHTGSRVVEPNAGALKMLILHSKNNNSKIKDKFINYKLGEVARRILDARPPSMRDAIICEFLIEELEKYVSSKLK